MDIKNASAIEDLENQLKFYKDREASICKAVGGVSDRGQYRTDVIEHLEMLYKEHGLMKDYIRAFLIEGETVERSAIMAGTNAPFLPGFLVIARRLISRIHL